MRVYYQNFFLKFTSEQERFDLAQLANALVLDWLFQRSRLQTVLTSSNLTWPFSITIIHNSIVFVSAGHLRFATAATAEGRAA